MIDRQRMTRREFAMGGAAATGLAMPGFTKNRRDVTIWTFDRLDRIGGVAAHAEGSPHMVSSPFGPAMAFDGIGDQLIVGQHPLAGATQFTFEVLFRPDGDMFAQRWFHLESDDPGPGMPPGDTRCLFEIRVHGDQWCLDTFLKGPTYSQALISDVKLHPLHRWYHVAQTYDGTTYRSYVDGEIQAEHGLNFMPQGPGRASIGARMNKVDHFKGAVREARFTRSALAPSQFGWNGRSNA